MRVAVIGAGPAGLTAAYQLCKAGISVDVFEASNAVGGMSRTLDLWNQKVDIGPHRFFSADRRVNDLWLEVVGRDYSMVQRLTRIFYAGKFFDYPLKPWNALSQLGPFEALRCVSSFARAQLSSENTDDQSFESWVTRRFGRRLFEIFFRSYSEKLWGISCKDLDADFAAQRIKKLSLLEAAKDAFSLAGRHRHRTLIDEFAYPHEGTGSVYERMATRIVSMGGRILLSQPIRRLLVDQNRVVGVEDASGSPRHYNATISSMPITTLVKAFPSVLDSVRVASQALTFRNTTIVYLHIDRAHLFQDNWIYVHSNSLACGRITNFRNWASNLYGDQQTTILALEYWSYDHDELWRAQDTALVELAQREARASGLIGDATILDGHVYRVPRSYPVYRRGYRKHVELIADFFRAHQGLQLIGRYGSFKYNNQDHSILMGILAAENLVAGREHDLWSVNSDYESYQESAVITATGLRSAA